MNMQSNIAAQLKISDWVQIASTVVLVVTLLVLIWQTRLLRRSTRTAALQTVYNSYFDLDRLVLENPEYQKLIVRGELYDRIETLSQEELREKSFIELVLDMSEMLYFQHRFGGIPVDIGLVRNLATNPRIQNYWATHAGTFRREFVGFFDACIAEALERVETNIGPSGRQPTTAVPLRKTLPPDAT